MIFSGGDPLVTTDQRLGRMIADLAAIPHLTRVRIHSRLPIVIPSRVTATLAAGLTATRLQPVLVLHCNHPQEVDAEVRDAVRRLRDAGIVITSYSIHYTKLYDQGRWEQRSAIFVAFSGPNRDRSEIEVDIFDPEGHAFMDPHSCA